MGGSPTTGQKRSNAVGTAPTVPGAPALGFPPADTSGIPRSPPRPRGQLRDHDRHDRTGPRPAHGLRFPAGHPYQAVTSTTPRSRVTFDYDDETDQVGYPIRRTPRSRASSPAGSSGSDSRPGPTRRRSRRSLCSGASCWSPPGTGSRSRRTSRSPCAGRGPVRSWRSWSRSWPRRRGRRSGYSRRCVAGKTGQKGAPGTVGAVPTALERFWPVVGEPPILTEVRASWPATGAVRRGSGAGGRRGQRATRRSMRPSGRCVHASNAGWATSAHRAAQPELPGMPRMSPSGRLRGPVPTGTASQSGNASGPRSLSSRASPGASSAGSHEYG